MRPRLIVWLVVTALMAGCGGGDGAATTAASGTPLRSLGVHFNPDTGLLALTAGEVTTEPGRYPDLQIAFADIGPRPVATIPDTCRGSLTTGPAVPSPQVVTKLQYKPTEGGAPLSREMIVNFAVSTITLEDCGDLSGSYEGRVGTFPGAPGPTEIADDGRIWEIIPILPSLTTNKSPSLPVRLTGRLTASPAYSADGTWMMVAGVAAPEEDATSPAVESQVSTVGSDTSATVSLERSTTDRPGPHVWDVKFFYVTFKDGPDERRDTNGQIGGIAADVNRYLESQFPGHRMRYDTFDGALDIQHIEFPITNEAYYALYQDEPGDLENFVRRILNDAGHPWTHGFETGRLPDNSRIYYLMVEGYRGKKFGEAGQAYDYECTGDSEFTYYGLSMRFLRRLNGTPCPGVVGHWVPTAETWAEAYSESSKQFVKAWPPPEFPGDCIALTLSQCRPWGWTMIQQFINLMLGHYGRPECEYVIREIIATPTPKRPYFLAPPYDIWASAAQFDRPLGHPDLAALDPDHSRYFMIKTGPNAKDPCRDIQYSPFWEMTDAATSRSGAKVYLPSLARSAVDRPGANRWDIKFIYVTFKGGPDNERDIDGSIGAMATEINRYFQSQYPGHRVRFDWYKGVLDVQHVQLPLTNEEFQDIFLRYRPGGSTLPTLDEILEKELKKVGLAWTSGYLNGKWNTNERGYVMLLEGHRGRKFHNGAWQDMICRHWDNEYGGITMRFLRDMDGNECTSLGPRWTPTEGQWADAYSEDTKQFRGAWPLPELMDGQRWWGTTVTRGITELLALMPGCARVTEATLKTPGPQRISESLPEDDIIGFGSRADRPIGHPELARLDPAHRYYFKIDNGPYVGDKCRDIQYSPYWETLSD